MWVKQKLEMDISLNNYYKFVFRNMTILQFLTGLYFLLCQPLKRTCMHVTNENKEKLNGLFFLLDIVQPIVKTKRLV